MHINMHGKQHNHTQPLLQVLHKYTVQNESYPASVIQLCSLWVLNIKNHSFDFVMLLQIHVNRRGIFLFVKAGLS